MVKRSVVVILGAVLMVGCGTEQANVLVDTANATLGKALYATSCIVCHGDKGQNRPLGAPVVVQGQSKGVLLSKLKGYKNGTYGGDMKVIMRDRIAPYSDEQLEQLATYMATF